MPPSQPPYDIDPDERLDRQANDHRLGQAIAYLTNEGGNDPAALYVKRIQAIDDHLLKKYAAGNYDFDRHLYQQLRAMVREVQSDNSHIAQEESEIDLIESDVSDTESPEALYRGDDDAEENRGDPLVMPRPRFRDKGINNNDVLQHKLQTKRNFKYGQGPDTQPEIWHANFPAILPLGETMFMREWDNQRIHFDLSEAKKNKGVVTTNVPYGLISDTFHPNETTYESGSRFKLPKPCHVTRQQSESLLQLRQTLNSFNNIGKFDADADTAPRIFLRKVIERDSRIPRVRKDSAARNESTQPAKKQRRKR
ncbi:hypothetical protein DM02DRAFT_724219 [Periconia macrospinosa]|uniref:Uncharacterized protein n=1 Tax=Periconia macrospinosa TaxID=97972 RepID=A0A2V1EA63_9PLEO|nr:hypothetical protein DM02DRAFT_724219 [Periconia macrospinosa]